LLFKERVYPICSPAYSAQCGAINSHKALANQPLLALDYEQEHHWLNWNRFFKARRSNQLASSPVISFNNYTLLIQAAMTGQGVGLGWANLVDDLLVSKALVAIEGFELSTNAGYYATNHSQANCSGLFIQWLQQRC